MLLFGQLQLGHLDFTQDAPAALQKQPPLTVRVILRELRWNKRTPSRSSSLDTLFANDDAPRMRPASEKLRVSATYTFERPPYNFSHTIIGAFGLVGALAATRAGQCADRGHAERTSAGALAALLLAWWPLSLLEWSLWPLLMGIVLLDLGGQALRYQSLIFRTRPEAHSRLVGLYILFYAIGSGRGRSAPPLLKPLPALASCSAETILLPRTGELPLIRVRFFPLAKISCNCLYCRYTL